MVVPFRTAVEAGPATTMVAVTTKASAGATMPATKKMEEATMMTAAAIT